MALGAAGVGVASAPAGSPALCTAELRSWVVAGWGRPLYLQCDCPAPNDHLSGRVEFTSASLRHDYTGPAGHRAAIGLGDAPIARMSRGAHLRPLLGRPDDRLEARYRVSPATAARLQRDRLFQRPYRLLGPNSNSAMRIVLENVGLPLPDHVRGSGGTLGAFPGVWHDPGDEAPPETWDALGFPQGPTRTPGG